MEDVKGTLGKMNKNSVSRSLTWHTVITDTTEDWRERRRKRRKTATFKKRETVGESERGSEDENREIGHFLVSKAEAEHEVCLFHVFWRKCNICSSSLRWNEERGTYCHHVQTDVLRRQFCMQHMRTRHDQCVRDWSLLKHYINTRMFANLLNFKFIYSKHIFRNESLWQLQANSSYSAGLHD